MFDAAGKIALSCATQTLFLFKIIFVRSVTQNNGHWPQWKTKGKI